METLNENFISAAKSIAYSATSLIGPNKCIKCIIDDDGHFELTSNVLKLLRVIKVDHAAISIIHDVCKGFHKVHGTCCSTLVFMMGSWLQSLEYLVNQGIPLEIVNHLLKEAVHVCIQEANKLSKSVDELTSYSTLRDSNTDDNKRSTNEVKRHGSLEVRTGASERKTTLRIGSASNTLYRPSNISNVSTSVQNSKCGDAAQGRQFKFISRYSRHFADADTAQKQEHTSRTLSKCIDNLSCGVARGNKVIENVLISLLELIKESKSDAKYLSDLKVPMDNVFVEFVDGRPEIESKVFKGLCVAGDWTDLGESFHSFENKPIKVCLLDFDKSKYCKWTVTKESSLANDVQKLVRFQVSCVIYRGERKHFKEECASKGITLLKVSSIKHLNLISIATGNPVVSSLCDLELKDVNLPIRLLSVGCIYESTSRGKGPHKLRPVISVQFSNEAEDGCYTILLSGVTPTITMLLEERLLSCLNRLNNILNDEKYILGAGWIESNCMQKLINYTEEDHQWLSGRAAPHWMQKDANLYRRTIFAEVAKGLQRYCSKLLQGAGPFDNNHQVIDALSSKCEAWRRAMRLVNMISRVDVVLTKA